MKASVRGLIGAVAVVVVALLAFSGGSSENPRTPPALPGLPLPFQTAATLGDGGVTAGVDAYGDIVDLRAPGPAGSPLIDNPYRRQLAGTVGDRTGIVPLVAIPGSQGPSPLWAADAVRQRFRPGTNVLLTTAAFGASAVTIECAANRGELGCISSSGGPGPKLGVRFSVDLEGGERHVHLDDEAARRIIAAAARSDRAWLMRSRPLGPGAPAWAKVMYDRSLLVLHAATDSKTGAVAAGARDGWAYVWPRDASAVAIALAESDHEQDARRVAGFLRSLDIDAAARFDGSGNPVPGRDAQGDAIGWRAAAEEAAGVVHRTIREVGEWRDRADYQERSPGDYLGNALSADAAGISSFEAGGELIRVANDPGSGPDSAAAWAIRPFSNLTLYDAARRSIQALLAGSSRYGLVPSADWGQPDPWSAPTAWSAWSLAAIGDRKSAMRLIADLRRAATPSGLLPERVDAGTGVPRSTTPLSWSHAFTALALRTLWPAPHSARGQCEGIITTRPSSASARARPPCGAAR